MFYRKEQGDMWREDKVTYEILDTIGVLSERGEWRKEVNLVSWNGNPPKVDVREWNSDHSKMSRGITLTEAEAGALASALSGWFEERSK
jgi:hypothetical protein